jgi:rhomboid family protein
VDGVDALVDALRKTWRFVRSAPLTYFWLIVLLYTTTIAHGLNRRQLHHLYVHRSTNLHHLGTDPIKVLIESLMWIDGRHWLPYVVVFTLFVAPAEHWLGWERWLAVGLIAHVGATYLSEGLLYLAIETGRARESLVNVSDIGVSYFVTGLVAVLAYHIAVPWRWGYIAAVLATFIVALVWHHSFAGLGHLFAVVIGLCCYPLTRGRAAPWDPARARARMRRAGA